MKEVKLFLLALTVIFVFLVAGTLAANSWSGNGVNITVWDNTDTDIKRSGWNTYFFSNYTNATSSDIVSEGNCTIRFQNSSSDYGSWENMSYNGATSQFEYNRTFNYKGIYYFEVNCSNSSSLIVNATDNFNISNSIPSISKEDSADWINFDGNNLNHDTWTCTEDTLCYFNFSANVTENDINDILNYTYGTDNTTLTNFSLDEDTGILEINVSHSDNTGSGKKIELKVKDNDTDTLWQAALLDVSITETNDAPEFQTIQNWSFNMSTPFEQIINVTDEENNTPYVLNISFVNCSTADWSSRNNSNCTLFNESDYSFNNLTGELNISFNPNRDDVGSYIINFSVTDNSSLGNKTTDVIANFTVLNVNEAPYFLYTCDNERNTTEDEEFTCEINVTDIDETNNLTITANFTWFLFNDSGSYTTNATVNAGTDYNASFIVNFTPTDLQVGNWSVNITVKDTGLPQGINSTFFWFSINNTEDIVELDAISNKTVNENKTYRVNATDNDLIINQTLYKEEVLTFSSNTSWVAVTTEVIGYNWTMARIDVDFDYASVNWGTGNYSITINVTDTANNYAERNFTLDIGNDTAANWSTTMDEAFIIYESNETYLNFSENISDIDGDAISFSFTNDSAFPSFTLHSNGTINFTSTNQDVGFHNITVNANDGNLGSLKTFNFTVLNVNDAPFIRDLDSGDNSSEDINGDINGSEDNVTTFALFIQDQDFLIPWNQENYYNESLTINVTIEGANTTLLNFVEETSYANNNETKFNAIFTPTKDEIGEYNITINVTDLSNASVIYEFNLTVNSIDHNPVLMNLSNQTSSVGESLYYRINATDIEDGNSTQTNNLNLTFSYVNLSGDDIFSSAFNTTTGELNITFSSTQDYAYQLNVTINDSANRTDSEIFWIWVYGNPNFTEPNLGHDFNLSENSTANLTFNVNHSVGDNLTYEFYISNSNGSDILRYNISYYGNGTNLTWEFTPNFTDETYGAYRNLTLIAYPTSSELTNASSFNVTYRWNVNISHENYPTGFSGLIGGGDEILSGGSPQTVTLTDYFTDPDASDSNISQTIGFIYEVLNGTTSGGTITVQIINWSASTTPIINFSATETSSANYSLTAYEYNASNASQILTTLASNNFSVELAVSADPTGGGSSGSSSGGSSVVITKPISLKLIMPDPLSAYKQDRIVLPITLKNDGTIDMYGINLSAIIAKNYTLMGDLNVSFDKNWIASLKAGKEENVTLTAIINTDEFGLYEITVNASVKDPKYYDWGKIYLTIQEANKTDVLERLIFTEEFIAENPECIEIKEILDEAWKDYEQGKFDASLEKARQALESCKYAISQVSLPRDREDFKEQLYKYISYSILFCVILGILYYVYKRLRFKYGG